MNESLFGFQPTKREQRSPSRALQARVVERPVAPRAAAHPVPTLVTPSPATQVPVTAPPQVARPSSSTSVDATLLAILESPIEDYEPAAIGFARKESELRQIFGTLGVLEARALHSRLASPRSGDQLAHAFLRLTADRRARLTNYLADARRRAALGGR